MMRHPLVRTLIGLKGNPRACVYTEPLWGIPFFLYYPYVSLYMLALGANDAQIGLITSLGLAALIIFGISSGAITDKFGRKRKTFISDLISWSIPMLIWAVAQDVRYCLVAVLISSCWRISANSWYCLLVEDPDDVAVTRAMVQAGKLLDISLLDQLIVSIRGFVSLKEKGLGFN